VAVVDVRSHAGYLFLGIILGHILLISAQVNSKSGVPVLESVTFGVFSELQRGIMSGTAGVRHVWSNYAGLQNAREENEILKRQLAEAQMAMQQQRAVADRARGLQELLDLRDRTNLQTTAAEIIGAAADPDFRTVTIDKGKSSGLTTDMAVMAPEGVVGRVVVPSARSAKVQLLIDRNAAAGVIIERSRAQGVAMGLGDGRLILEYTSDAFDVAIGDDVVTSGIDGIYPKGLPVGKVEELEKNGASFKRIIVRPAVNFARIEEVLVVLTPTPLRDAAAADAAVKK
jgi:rod shape-determining protein MreC